MPRTLLSVLHLQQRTEADCLPVCAQMVLNYLNLTVSYEKLVTLLETKGFGTPFRNIKRVEQLGVSVQIEHLSLTEINSYVAKGLPVIACVHTADLSYWSQTVDHVVVVVGLDEREIYLNDPSLSYGPHSVPDAEFELAQLNYDHLCAIIRNYEHQQPSQELA